MASTPRVSVLMPILNPHPQFFPQAVRSVLDQTMQDLELVIVEDPAQRRAADMLAGFEDPRIVHHCNTQRTGQIAQRNRTVALARAEYVALLDGDDIALPQRLEHQLDYLEHHVDVGVIGSQLEIIDHDGAHLGYREYPTAPEHIRRVMKRFNPIAQPSVMCRKQVLEGVGGYCYDKYSINSDYDLWCRLALHGVRLANLPDVLLQYRIHAESIKSSKLREVLKSTIDIKQTHWRDDMDLAARLRLWAERCLLLLPQAVVLRLFMRTQYQAQLPTPARPVHAQ